MDNILKLKAVCWLSLQAVLFDFDYTLADSSLPVVTCVTHALASYGLPVPERLRIERTIGLPLTETFHQLAPGADAQKLSEAFLAKADEVMVRDTMLFPEVPAAIDALVALGLELGIVSGKYRFRLEAILAKYGLVHCFKLLLGGDDVREMKPSPEGILTACKRLGLAPQQALFAGDSLVDAEAAARAGMRFVAVLHGRTGAEEFAPYKPLVVLPDLSPLLALAQTLIAA